MHLLLFACVCAAPPPDPVPAPVAATGGVLAGSCEASSIVPWAGGWAVGDNEQTGHLLRYDAAMRPAGTLPLATAVDDIEAVTVSGDSLLLTGSYSRNKSGALRPERAWTGVVGAGGATLELESACAPCRAARLAPPEMGGLNVEGLAVVGDDVWLGLRSPIVDGKAVLLRVAGGLTRGAADEMRTVDLGGRGVRELVPWGAGLLVLAGPAGGQSASHRVYWLASPDAAPVDLAIDLPPSTEGIAVDGTSLLYVIDGDGKGEPCATPARWGRVAFTPPG
jgi:Protein of unknown function (DUF3616)